MAYARGPVIPPTIMPDIDTQYPSQFTVYHLIERSQRTDTEIMGIKFPCSGQSPIIDEYMNEQLIFPKSQFSTLN